MAFTVLVLLLFAHRLNPPLVAFSHVIRRLRPRTSQLYGGGPWNLRSDSGVYLRIGWAARRVVETRRSCGGRQAEAARSVEESALIDRPLSTFNVV